MNGPIFLVGFMGSGKSEVGREVARRLGWTFLDLDEEIVRTAGCSIPDLFANEGEAGFRKREREAYQSVPPASDTVVSCGGGIVTQEDTLADLLQEPAAVCLQVSAEEVWARVGQDPNRPLLHGENPQQRVRELLTERAPLYDQIPIQIPTDGLRSSEVVDRILSELRKD